MNHFYVNCIAFFNMWGHREEINLVRLFVHLNCDVYVYLKICELWSG
jgi:hypothetical protein